MSRANVSIKVQLTYRETVYDTSNPFLESWNLASGFWFHIVDGKEGAPLVAEDAGILSNIISI